MGDMIVISVLALTVGGILRKMIKDRKQGKTSCGCDCSKCGKCCSYEQK